MLHGSYNVKTPSSYCFLF
jgi:hypothetical protein